MEELSDVRVVPMPESPYVKPFRLLYTQGGRAKSWDLLEVHDSVAVVIFNTSRRVLVLVRQFRPAVYYNRVPEAERARGVLDPARHPAALGLSLEVCAGIVDKPLPLEQIAAEEVLEECGYRVRAERLERVLSYCSGVGVQGALQTLYFAEVTDGMREQRGGGVDDELIDVVEVPLAEVPALLRGPGPLPSPPSFLFAISWFLANKAPHYEKSFAPHCAECKSDQ